MLYNGSQSFIYQKGSLYEDHNLRVLSIAMAAMFLLSLGACRKQDPPPQDSGTTAPDTDPDPDQTSGEPQETDPVPTFDLTIHGTPISKYRIVYEHIIWQNILMHRSSDLN